MYHQGADIVIFWGSEGGTAERFANRLANELEQRFGLRSLVADLAEYDHQHLFNLEETRAITAGFILSTYGDGDPPENTNGLWRALAHAADKPGTAKLGSSLEYFIFGLGNRNYRHYNRVARTVEASLQRLEATRLGPAGEGDDASGGTEEDFLAWKQELTNVLRLARNLDERPQMYRPSIEIREVHEMSDTEQEEVFLGEPHPFLLPRQRRETTRPKGDSPFILPVEHISELSTSTDRKHLHLEFSLKHVPWAKYQTGDYLAIWPVNPSGEVDRLLDLLGLKHKAKMTISITPSCGEQAGLSSSRANTPSSAVPPLTTIEALLRHYLEICGPLSRDTVAALAQFAPHEASRSELRVLTSSRETFEAEVLSQYCTLAGLMARVAGGEKWTNLPLSFLAERLRRTQPRRYSISSSAITQPRRPSVTVVVDTPCGANNHEVYAPGVNYGLTGNYLLSLKRSSFPSATTTSSSSSKEPPFQTPDPLIRPHLSPGATSVFAQIRRSAFRLPPRDSTPVILIGAGTGIAPLRAFVQERARLAQIQLGRGDTHAAATVGDVVLIMGFRRRGEDFLYAHEWEQRYAAALGESLRVWTAFSREDGDGKVYVQDQVREHAAEIFEMLEMDDRSSVYVCGSARMASDVVAQLKESWVECCRGKGEDVGAGAAEEWVSRMKRIGRLHEDIWG